MSDAFFRSRLDEIRTNLVEAAQRVGRTDEVTLVAVSKSVEVDRIRAAAGDGQHVFGENRAQEASAKIDALSDVPQQLSWHFLGHVQTNKVKSIVGRFSCIQSVDSLRVAVELDRRAGAAGISLPVLVEVNMANEPTKSGFDPEDLKRDLSDLAMLTSLRVRGLMTIAPYVDDPEDARSVFRRTRELRDEIRERQNFAEFTQLSMGMSNDYAVAVEEGATMVRIGRALFGDRSTAARMRQT